MYGIFTYMSLKYMVNVGQYASPMEHLGLETSQKLTSMMMGGKCIEPLLNWRVFYRGFTRQA